MGSQMVLKSTAPHLSAVLEASNDGEAWVPVVAPSVRHGDDIEFSLDRLIDKYAAFRVTWVVVDEDA